VSVCSLGELGVSVFGDGFAELPRHMLTASFLADLLLLLLLWHLALAWTLRSRG
jgi:hypothetical protein